MKIFFSITILFLFSSCIVQNPEAEIQNEKIENLKDQIDFLNTKIEHQLDETETLKKEIDKLNEKLEKLSSKTRFKSKKQTAEPINVNVKINKEN